MLSGHALAPTAQHKPFVAPPLPQRLPSSETVAKLRATHRLQPETYTFPLTLIPTIRHTLEMELLLNAVTRKTSFWTCSEHRSLDFSTRVSMTST